MPDKNHDVDWNKIWSLVAQIEASQRQIDQLNQQRVKVLEEYKRLTDQLVNLGRVQKVDPALCPHPVQETRAGAVFCLLCGMLIKY